MDTNEAEKTEVVDVRAPRGITSSDVNAQGNVVLWDHGPTEPPETVERDSDEYKRLEAEARAWRLKNSVGPVPITMGQGDARHAMEVEPLRYSLDPYRVNEAEVEAEIENIRAQRIETARLAAERADAIQLAADRKAAIAVVEGRRRAAAAADRAPRRPPQPETDADAANAYRVEQQRSSDAQNETDRKAAIEKAGTAQNSVGT